MEQDTVHYSAASDDLRWSNRRGLFIAHPLLPTTIFLTSVYSDNIDVLVSASRSRDDGLTAFRMTSGDVERLHRFAQRSVRHGQHERKEVPWGNKDRVVATARATYLGLAQTTIVQNDPVMRAGFTAAIVAMLNLVGIESDTAHELIEQWTLVESAKTAEATE